MRALLAEIGRQYAEGIRSTLPHSEQEAGVWLSGLLAMLVIQLLMLVIVTHPYWMPMGGR